MAQLSDITLIRSIGPLRFVMKIWSEVVKDQLTVWAAAMAYSWILAIFPFFIFLLAFLPYLPQEMRDHANTEVKNEIDSKLPGGASGILWNDLAENTHNLLHHNSIHDPAAWIMLGVAVWVASGGMSMTMGALDRCYDLNNVRPYWKQRLYAIVLTLIVAVLLLVVLCLLPLATTIMHWMLKQEPVFALPMRLAFDVVRWIVSLGLMILILAIIYYFGPSARIPFSLLTPGSAFVVIVWVLLGVAFRQYVERIGAVGAVRIYGALGGVAIMLLLFFLDALVLLIGAEINAELDFAAKRITRQAV